MTLYRGLPPNTTYTTKEFEDARAQEARLEMAGEYIDEVLIVALGHMTGAVYAHRADSEGSTRFHLKQVSACLKDISKMYGELDAHQAKQAAIKKGG
jgi:hypothetical protein